MNIALSQFQMPTPSRVTGFPATPSLGAPGAHRGPSGQAVAAVLPHALDCLDYGLMLLDAEAQVRFANRSARLACAPGTALRIVDEQLRCAQARDEQRLLRSLAAALGGRRSLVVLATPGSEPCTLAVVPVDDMPDPVALVVFARRHACEPLTVEFFAREHGLTGAETAVLRQLTHGARPAAIARAAGVAIATVRTQITSIRAKTGACSIGELLHRLTVLPPIVARVGN